MGVRGNPAVPDSFIAGFSGFQVLAGNNFQFIFQRYRYYSAAGLQYSFQYSQDLRNWSDFTPNVISASVNEDDTFYEVMTMGLPAALTSGQHALFLRILVQASN